MKRGTSHDKTNTLLKSFREKVPNMAIRTTLIVGYPGETEKKFQELKQWVQDTKFDRLGVFTYSHEENTSAYDLEDDVPEKIKKARAEEIMDLQTHISWELNQEKIGKIFKVLFDRKEGDFFIGRTEFDSPDVDNEVLVRADETYIRIGDFANIKIEKTDHFDLYGVVAH
jgi:ribosomal protein S12 methylthiotransferase